MFSQWDRDNIDSILSGHGTWFHAGLLRLIMHADMENRALLRLGFPEEVAFLEERFRLGKAVMPVGEERT
jgi:hypothetical protein